MACPAKTLASGGTGELIGGRYRLGRVIGRGGMSVVHEATDTVLDAGSP